MTNDDATAGLPPAGDGRRLVLERLRWHGDHTDTWSLFRDGVVLKSIVSALVAPFRAAALTAVCGIESRGFLLGGAAAAELGVGFVAVRKGDGYFPGSKLVVESAPDYQDVRHQLRVQRAALRPGDRVLLVDDWIETGNQALAVRELLAAAGAELVGCAVIIDQLPDEARRCLGRVHRLVTHDELSAATGTG